MNTETKVGMILLIVLSFVLGLMVNSLYHQVTNKYYLLEVAPNPGQPGYQISYIDKRGDKQYYYPITEQGKDRFLEWIEGEK